MKIQKLFIVPTMLALVAFQVSAPLWADGSAQPSVVKVMKDVDGWHMTVDGKIFYAKGVGCIPGNSRQAASDQEIDTYLQLAKDMGANAVRTWGNMPRQFFDKAQADGLKVNLGIWVPSIRNGSSTSYLDPY